MFSHNSLKSPSSPATTDYVKCLANPTATSNIISAGLDRNIIVWDTRKESSHVSPIHTSKTGIYSLATDVSGSTVVYGGPDGLLRILDTRQPQTSPKAGVALIGHKDTVKSILLHDTTLVTAGADSICKIWDIRYAHACAHAMLISRYFYASLPLSLSLSNTLFSISVHP